MKRTALSRTIVALVICACTSTLNGRAADASPTSSTVAPASLPYGVADVLKLARAKVAEETIVSFIQNSGTVYNLAANDIVHLRNEGVSDRVINAMLEQKKKFIEQQPAIQPAPTTSAASPQTAAADQPTTSQPAPAYVQPPLQPAPSSVYVIPYPAVPSAYYGYYRPYPYYYGGYWGPSISLGFRFGGGHWGGHHWGGHHWRGHGHGWGHRHW